MDVEINLTIWGVYPQTEKLGIFKNIKDETELHKYIGQIIGKNYKDQANITTIDTTDKFKYDPTTRAQIPVDIPKIYKSINIEFGRIPYQTEIQDNLNNLFKACTYYTPTNEQ